MTTRQIYIMKTIKYNLQKKAFVLSLVLWITAAMMLLALLFIRMSKEETIIYKKMHQKLELEIQAQSLFEQLSFYLSTGKFKSTYVQNELKGFPNKISLDKNDYNITKGKMICHYSLFDHSALFNLRFLLVSDIAQRTIESIIHKNYPFQDIYFDWIDRDDLSRINGAEKSEYLLNDYGYIPANLTSFQQKESLYLLKDMYKLDQNNKNKIIKYFTTYGNVPINIMLIDLIQLQAFFPEKDIDDLKRLIFLRENNPAKYISLFKRSKANQDSYSTLSSKTVTINIECSQKGVLSRQKIIVDFSATNSRSWAILEFYKY